MPTFSIDAPNGKSYSIEGENAQGALDALRKHLGGDTAAPVAATAEPADHGLSERQKLSPVEKAISPITSYPATYQRMNQEARDQMSQGVNQIRNSESLVDPQAHGIADVLTGAGKTALGALGYVASPINAAYRSVIGQPVEDVTGIPREHTEFAAQLATPGIGLTGKAPAPKIAPAAKPKAPSIDELYASADKNYSSPAVKQLELKPQTLGRYSDETTIALNKEGFDENVAPVTFSILGKLTKAPADSVVTGDNLNSVRKLLGKAAATGGEEGNAASRAISALDDFVPSIAKKDVLKGDPEAAAQSWEAARGDYSAAKQSEKIDNKRVSAEIRAGAVNAGQNVAGKIRQNMAAIADPTTPKNARGLLPEEVAAARQIAEGTPTQNALRNVGDALGGGGGIRAGVLGVGGAILGGAPGAAIPLVGHALRAISNKLTIRQAEKLSEAIRLRAPLASSSEKFNEAAISVQQARSPKAIAGVVLAARNLSNNLRSSGFNISPSDLLKGLQSPSTAGAEQQQ